MIEADTVAQALSVLATRYPGLGPVLDAGVTVFVNGEAVVNRHERLPENASLHLLQQMKGG